MSSADGIAVRSRRVVGRGSRNSRSPVNRGQRIAPYLFLTPGLALFGIFSFIPILASVYLSFQDVAVFGAGQWVGTENYQEVVHDPLFWTSVQNTVVFTLGSVPTSMAVGLLLAILLNRHLPGRGLIRSLYFLPMVVSGVAVSLIMAWLFNADYGLVNNGLTELGLPRMGWLTSPDLAMLTLILVVVWTRIGFCMVVYLAALQSVPQTLIEASQLDGAGRWRQFQHLIWPLLRPTTFLLLVVNVVFSLQAFDIIYVLTGGGPGFSTTVLIQYVFRAAFIDGRMGYAGAMGVIFTLVLLLFTLLRYRASRHAEDIT